MVFNWTGSHLGRDGRKGAGLSVLVVALGCICVAAGAARAQTCPPGSCTANWQCHETPIDRFCTLDLCRYGRCICDVDDLQCEDGLFCNGIGYCDTATDSCNVDPTNCESPTPYCSEALNECVHCLETNQCTTPLLCDTSSGTCVECLSSAQCQNGLFCDGFETCDSAGECQPGTPPNCPKKCFRGTAPPGTTCTTDENCGAGGKCLGYCSELRAACVQCDHDGSYASGGCDDGAYCSGAESCQSDDCVAGAAPNCRKCVWGVFSVDACTVDADCSTKRCAGGAAEGITCTGDANCRVCVGGTNPGTQCTINAQCLGGGTCPAGGTCAAGTCDGSPSYCDEANDRCQVCLTDAHCNDGLFCTSDDCTHIGLLNVCNNMRDPGRFCDNGVVCDGSENCSADNTSCVPGTPLTCNKTCFRGATPGAVCTTDGACGKACLGISPPMSCTSDSNCPKKCLGGADDGAPCSSGGECLSGVCQLRPCVPGLCRGVCSETFGGCVQCENNATCDDGLFCDGSAITVPPTGETCSPAGQCVAGTAPNCSSLDDPPCAAGACNESQDLCVMQAQNNGSQCEDGDHCTASSKCSNRVCVNDPPAANDPYRCVRLEWRPSTTQTVKVGSTVTVSLYAVADQCNTPSDNCPANQAPVSGIVALLGWTPTVLELQASTSQNPNPQDPCNNSNSCTQCQTCTGGNNPGASCTQQCVGGANHGQVCFNSIQCPSGQCYSGPVCLGGTQNGNQCTVNGNCPGGTCNTTNKCLSGGTCAAPTAYNWASSMFPNDCPSSQMNGPCPWPTQGGFPGNDGDAYYQSIQPLSCGSPPVSAPSACVPSTGLYVTNIKFKAISNPGGGAGTNTTVSILPCGPYPAHTIVQSILTPPSGYFTDDVLKSLGPPANIKVVVCTTNADCNDGDGCTLDVCANNACQHTPRDCQDVDPCTVDACVNDNCTHTPVACAAEEICYLGLCYTPCATVAECDDGVACTVDTCDTTPPPPIDGICLHAPDDALCDTGLFCSAKVCDAELGCVFDHECFSSNGNPCPSAATCDEGTNTCGGCNPPTAVGIGCRYLAVTPAAQGSTPIALRVIGECHDTQSACVARYVQSKCNGGANDGVNCFTDDDCPKRCAGGTRNGLTCTTDGDCPFGTCAGRCDAGTLGSTPFYKTASQWGTAMVRGAQIRPSADYFVETQCNFPGVVLSAAASARTKKWGDVDGNGIVDALDIAKLVDAFKGIFVVITFQQANLWPCTPDDTIDANDISKVVDAFKGYAFPCGITCP